MKTLVRSLTVLNFQDSWRISFGVAHQSVVLRDDPDSRNITGFLTPAPEASCSLSNRLPVLNRQEAESCVNRTCHGSIGPTAPFAAGWALQQVWPTRTPCLGWRKPAKDC